MESPSDAVRAPNLDEGSPSGNNVRSSRSGLLVLAAVTRFHSVELLDLIFMATARQKRMVNVGKQA